jgi:predicted Rossmann-fold nucleotide-binding protein
MGSHKTKRNAEDYKNMALVAHALSVKNVLVGTGGGPGAMEAGYLGASASLTM